MPLTDVLTEQATLALNGVVNQFNIDWVWMPPWGVDKVTEDGREMMSALGFSISQPTASTRTTSPKSGLKLARASKKRQAPGI